MAENFIEIWRGVTMSKYVIECPSCGRFAEAEKGFLGIGKTKSINCGCGYIINVQTDKMATRTCAHCGNLVVFDQSKGEAAVCPVCHEHINTRESLNNLVKFSCPSCSCGLSADRNATNYICPLCETVIDVQSQFAKEEIKKDGIASVIKYEGDNDTLIWKHPIEDFNMGSQLIVHESQEAIFFRDGQALDLFGAGRYTLETFQLPIMEKMYQLPSDSEKTFHSEVYFINKAQQMSFRWGTSKKVTLIDPNSQAPIAIGARGIFNFRVSNSRKMLLKLVGTTSGMNRADFFGENAETTKSHARDYFRSIVQLGVSTKLAEVITEQKLDILQIDQQKMKLSLSLKEALTSYFDDYGMEITEFLVEGIVLPQPGELGYDVVQTLIKLRQANLQKSVIATETDIKLSEIEAKKTIDIRTEENKVEVETAHREVVAAKGQTEVLQAQIAGQKKLAATQYDVEAERLQMELEMQRKAQTAQIEAEEMRAKGFNQRDVIQGQVMTAFAENQPKDGGMNMSGMAGEAMQAGIGFATMGAMAGLATNMMGTGAQIGKDMTGAMVGATANLATGVNDANIAPNNSVDNSNVAPGGFDLNHQNGSALGALVSGKLVADGMSEAASTMETIDGNGWKCQCGMTGITSKFCPECGSKRPESKPEELQQNTWTCKNCGTVAIISKFCPECGMPKA